MALYKNPKCDLKRSYRRYVLTAVIITLLFLITAFRTFPDLKSGHIETIVPQDVITAMDIPKTEQTKDTPPPPRPAIPIELSIEETALDDIEFIDTGLDENEEVNTAPPPVYSEEEKKEQFDDYEFIVVEEQPYPIGGIEGIMSKITYPPLAVKTQIQGRVYIIAYVNENGEVVKGEIHKGIGMGCEEEALKAVLATKFSPGKQRGKPVKVKVMIPILFKLN